MSRRVAGSIAWAVVAVLAVAPLILVAVQAVTSQWFFPDLVPDRWSTETLTQVASASDTARALRDSLMVSTLATVVSLLLAVPAARALAFTPDRRRAVIGAAVLAPLTLPPVAVAMGLNVAFLRVGLDGGIVPVVLAHQMVTLPYAVLIMWAALTRYDPAFERQAMLLGASPQRVVAQVFVPLAASALLVTAAITFVVSWGQYLLTLLPGGGRLLTLPVLVLNAANGGNPTAGATLALIAAIPPALAILLVVRRLTAPNGPGMTRS